MKTHVGVLTRNPYKHPGGKVAYCTLSTMDEDLELVVFRKNNRAYQTLLSLAEGAIVEARGTIQIDRWDNSLTKQLIVQAIAKDELKDMPEPDYELDMENLPDVI